MLDVIRSAVVSLDLASLPKHPTPIFYISAVREPTDAVNGFRRGAINTAPALAKKGGLRLVS